MSRRSYSLLFALSLLLIAFSQSIYAQNPDTWCSDGKVFAEWRDDEGNITDRSPETFGVYFPNTVCGYMIDPDDRPIRVEFNRFDLEDTGDDGGDTVWFDYLEINRDGVSTRYAGNDLPCSFTHVSQDPILILFVTDDADENGGWELTYSTLNTTIDNDPSCNGGEEVSGLSCQGLVVNGDAAGTLEDGSGGEDYDPNLACMWVVGQENSGNTTVNLTQLDVESSTTCMFDYLSFVSEETDSPPNGVPTRVCGEGDEISNDPTLDIPLELSTEGRMIVIFRTDEDFQTDGWTMDWTSEDSAGEPSPSPTPSPAPRLLTSSALICLLCIAFIVAII